MENHNITQFDEVWYNKHCNVNRWTILEDGYQIIQSNTFLYSLTSCLGLHSKMCAAQMNTSDNLELWDIQLSYWLFWELTWQLCPCLMASSCYFFASHTMHAVSSSRLRKADFRSPNHALVTNGSIGRLLVRQAPHVHASLHAQSLSKAISHWQAQRFTIAAFATIGCHCFPHEETQNWGNMYSHKLYTTVITAYDPTWTSPYNFSVLHAIFWGSSASPLILSWLDIHSTLTIHHYTRLLTPALTVSTTSGNPK